MIHTLHFTLEEANQILDEIKPMIEEMIALKKKLDNKGYDVYNHQYFGGSGPNGKGAFPDEMDRLVEILRDITSRGILIKGLDNGLIDFPHIRANEEEVYLCWKYDEGDIKFWHKIPDGYSGRRSIDEL
ncbi:MAG: DUF2203 domain-containing protein [Ignavibacteria bacterium]|nr:DUF2203 domain-containing protein [Ignavibacteria bacterium]